MDQSPRVSVESSRVLREGLLQDSYPPLADHRCPNCASRAQLRLLTCIPWALTLVLLVSLAAIVMSFSMRYSEKGFWRESEFLTVKRELPAILKDVQFDSTLRYNDSHQIFRPETEPPYVGAATAEIDENWVKLLGAVNVFVTPTEREQWGEDLWLDPETGLYMAQVSVFHQIHCLNMIRKFLHREQYPEIEMPSLIPHVEHCIDAIRLALMCAADMTFIPVRWSENRDWIIPIFDIPHTCRDYDALRDWSIARDASNPEIYHENAQRMIRQGL